MEKPLSPYRQNLLSQLEPLSFSNTKDLEIRAFPLPLKVVFLTGVQIQTQWIMTYGPQKVGKNSLSYPIYEKDTPDICFELFPEKEAVIFQTSLPHIVQLNHKVVDQAPLLANNVIHINKVCVLRLTFFHP